MLLFIFIFTSCRKLSHLHFEQICKLHLLPCLQYHLSRSSISNYHKIKLLAMRKVFQCFLLSKRKKKMTKILHHKHIYIRTYFEGAHESLMFFALPIFPKVHSYWNFNDNYYIPVVIDINDNP